MRAYSPNKAYPHQQEIMIFRLSTQILEDALFPISLHMVPIVDEAMSDWVMDAIRLRIGDCLVTDVKVEVLDAALGR